MTLLISAVTRNHAFHASDRLLTFSRNRAIEEHDHRANKTIVVVGSDCWIVFGYTGVAYLDGKPTDQVIAEGIAGVSDLSQRMMLLRGNNQMKIHFWEIGNRTVAAVEPAFRRLPHSAQKHGLTLLGTALQFTRKRWRHIDFNMTFTPAGWTSEGDPGRHFSWNSYKLLSAGAVDPEIDRRMHERFTHEGVVSADRMRSVMVDAVRETGSGSPTVGENVISVVLAPLAQKFRLSAGLA